jgi:hypothetical protein
VVGVEGGEDQAPLGIVERRADGHTAILAVLDALLVRGRQLVQRDVGVADDVGALDDALQLADVAGPGVRRQRILDFRGQARIGAVLLVQLVEEYPRQADDVVAALLERRQPQREPGAPAARYVP